MIPVFYQITRKHGAPTGPASGGAIGQLKSVDELSQ